VAGPGSTGGFAARLAAAVAERETQVVLGLDPDPARVWPQALAADPQAGSPADRAAEVVVAHCAALIAAAGPACVAIKPQVACFERLGAPGWAALDRVVAAARAAGLLVLADGKRGDIDVTATAYAQTFLGATPTPFGTVQGVGADALTVNPYLGDDAVRPFLTPGSGLFVLVRTSNPGAAGLQDADLAAGGRVWEHVARMVDALGREAVAGQAGQAGHAGRAGHAGGRGSGRGAAVDLADVGAVVGATVPEHLARARELMPRAVFLLPGIGAQGGRVEDVAPAFAPGRAGGLVTASRSIARAHEQRGGSPADAARAEAERLRAQAWSVS
jgi:orotidine-5'-phosphate decarboxylase